MADADTRIVMLLEQLVKLHQEAAERQSRMLQITEQNYAEVRQRADASIELQRVAVARQRRFGRIWLGVVVPLLLLIGILLYWLSRLSPPLHNY